MSHSAENVKGGPFLIYKHAFCCKITKNSKGGPFGTIKNFRKKSHSAEKCRRGDPLGLINIHSVAKYEKTRRADPFETLKNFSEKKSHRAENTLRRAYPLIPLSFLDDVKILLRKLLRQYFKFAK